MKKSFGGIEAGGTKFVCMLGTETGQVIEETRFPTTHPDETIQQAIAFFAPHAEKGELVGIGIASFGPLDLHTGSATYGHITSTPKLEWQQVDLYGRIRSAFGLPVTFDTDVNAAAFGEHTWSAENRRLDPFVYVTIGTGIGVGVLANGAPIHGLMHAEAGHAPVPHDRERDPFRGVCPFHGDCLEGLASGPAMEKRWGQRAESLPDGHPAWELEADYIALSLVGLIYAYSPERIVLGGGVPEHAGLHDRVRRKVQKLINGYIQSALILEKIEQYIVPPTLGNRSGGLGAIGMAIQRVGQGG